MKEMSSERIAKRNFVLNFVEGAIYAASGALISAQTVLPALVTKLGGGNVAVGAVGVIVWVGLFLPQTFAARYVETHPWKKPWAIKYGLSQRIVLLVFGLCLLMFGADQPSMVLWMLLAMFSLNQILMGITTPGWFEMFAKLIPTTKRGRLVGIRSSLGGLGAIGCGMMLTWFLVTFPFPLNYSLAFFAAFLLQSVSIIVQSNLIEEQPSPVGNRKPFFIYLRQLPKVVQENIPFRNFLRATIVQILATMPVGFYTVYALHKFSADESVVGKFTLAIVAVQVVSSLGIGFLTDRRGNKLTLVIAACALFLANVWAMFAPSLEWFMLVYIFLGVNLGTELLARYNISIEYGPPEQRATYVGLMNTLIAPFYFVGMMGGALSDAFGYTAVFGIGSMFSVLGILLMVCTVREPRSLPKESVGRRTAKAT
jgi:MFS family permease